MHIEDVVSALIVEIGDDDLLTLFKFYSYAERTSE